MSIPTCDSAPSFPLDFRLHLDLDSNKRTDGFAAHLSVSAGRAWNNFPPKIYVSILHVTSCSHAHWKARATHLLLSCVRAGVLGSGVGKDAKTKQPTITTGCQWSQQRLSMQSHKEGSKSQLVPVCLYSLTASQNSSAKTVQNSRYNPFGSALDVKMEKIDDLRMISIKSFQVYSIKVYGFCILLYNV